MVKACHPPPLPTPITQYQDEHLTARNLAPLTRINYASDLKQVGRYITEQLGLVHIDQVRPRHLDGFLVTLDQRGLRGSSRRRKVATIRSLFRFLVQQGILPPPQPTRSCHRSGSAKSAGC